MSRNTVDKLAKDIVLVLKYNPELSDDDKILSVSLRLQDFANDIEKACAETHKRLEENKVIIDSRPHDIPQLQALLLKAQEERGSLN